MKHSRVYHFRVRRIVVHVVFGLDGRARTLGVVSERLVINGVPISSGIDAVAAAMPGGIERSDCSPGYYTEFSAVGDPNRYVGFGLWDKPAMAAITMVDLTIPRSH